MKRGKKIKIINIARILIIVYIAFISLFAFDAEFELGFFIHLIPSLILISTLVFTWKHPFSAGILFIIEGIGTVIVWNTYRDLFVLLAVSAVPVLIGTLFLISKNPKH